MARPKKNEKEFRNIQYKVLLNKNENILFQKKLENSTYKSMAEMLRDIVLKNRYQTVTNDEEMFQIRNQMLNQVKKIGNNFNQLLKHFNQKKKDNFTEDDVKKMLELMKSIQYLYVEINDNFKL